MWKEITDLPPDEWPEGKWVITWEPGIGWNWQKAAGARIQALYKELVTTRGNRIITSRDQLGHYYPIDVDLGSTKCDRQGCNEKANQYVLLRAGAIHLCPHHVNEAKHQEPRDAVVNAYKRALAKHSQEEKI